MAKVRIGTFNVENLFARYRFGSKVDVATAVRDGWNADARRFTIHSSTSKRITGKTIRELKADILALQEVENLDVLKRFRTGYLGGRKAFPHLVLIDGNDPRLIDVAVISKFPIVHVQSYQHLRTANNRAYIFSRDCLEVDVELPGSKRITLFVNHLKSMMGGRGQTRSKRLRQSQKVREIVTRRFGTNAGAHPFVILGDLNDYIEPATPQKSGIVDLVQWNQVVNVLDRLPLDERWTHFWKKKKEYRQLDFLLLSKSLANANPGPPEVMRKGQPKRAVRYTGPRFPGVGKDEPKASDHCPVVIELNV